MRPFFDLTRRTVLVACLLFSPGQLLVSPALAQADQASSDAAEPGPIDREKLNDLLQTLEDPAQRDAFVERLRTLLEASEQTEGATPIDSTGAHLLAALSERVGVVTGQLEAVVQVLLGTPEAALSALRAVQDPEVRLLWLELIVKVTGVMLAGLTAAWLAGRFLARPRHAIEAQSPEGWPMCVLLLAGHGLLEAVRIAAFAAVAFALLPILEPRPVTRVVVLTLINAHILVEAILLVSRTVLAPELPALRPYRLPDESAAYIHLWIRRLTVVGVYGYFIAEAALLLGLPGAAHAVVLTLLGLLIAGLLIIAILQNRGPVAEILRGRGEDDPRLSRLRGHLAGTWHLLAIFYVVVLYFVWALGISGGFEFLATATLFTLGALIAARLAIAGINRALDRLFRISPEVRELHPQLEERSNRYRPILTRILEGAVCVLAGLVILQAWSLDVFGWFATDQGQAFWESVATILLILAAAFVIWEVASAIIERYLRKKAEQTNLSHATRMSTLLPLFKISLRVVLIVMVAMIVLSELGVNIGPLLAGAGVVGLAVGFGAQALVKDIITGVFILVEDIIAVGDWVDVGSHAGMVEGMTIRTLRLRDLSGDMRVVPFGEVTSVHKVARDFSYALMDIGVAYREDVDEVIGVLKEVGAGMESDPAWSASITAPLEVFGLNSFGASSVDVRVRLRTMPLKQWSVRREFYRRLKAAFDEKGIEIPFPHQTIYFGVDREGKAPPARLQIERLQSRAAHRKAAE